jgi:predicted nucleic acid-binding protein
LLVIDANIIVKLVCNEPGCVEASDRLRFEPALTSPDWVLVEAAHSLRRKSLNGEFEPSDAAYRFDAIQTFFEEIQSSAPLSGKAMALSFELNHWVYDCIYLACALNLGSKLLTADRKFWNAAKRAGYEDVIDLLTWEGQAN